MSENIRKITLLISSLSSGGAERVTCNLANFLYKKGFIVDVITLTNRDDTYKLSRGIKRVCLLAEKERKSKAYNLLKEWGGLKKYVLENPDVDCYITMLPINIYMLTKLRKKIKGKIIISDRADPASYGCIYNSMMNYGVKKCDGLIVQTEKISEWYKHVKNKVVIPNAINEDINTSRSNTIKKKFVAVGRLNEQKNYPMILEAFKKFNTRHFGYVLEIYGRGGEEKLLKEIVKQYGLTGKVKFMGYVKDVSKQISDATCFLMASNYEGMSNALIEAMCMGLPCVVTDCDGGGARDLVINMENGILVKKGAVDEMVLGMNRIIEDEKFNKKVSSNARKLKEKLDPDKIYGEWLKFIEKTWHGDEKK